MADLRWTGAASTVAQVDTFTPGGTIEASDIFILTITGWDGTSTAISAAAGGTGAGDVVTAMIAAWNASTHTLCTPITASGTNTLIMTADTAGEAFSIVGTTTETGGGAADDQTFSKASTTASAGPKHWDSVNNWDTGAIPVATNNVYIENASDEIIYGLSQAGATLTSLNIGRSFTGKIGYDGASGFSGTYLQIDSSEVNIGYNYTGGNPSGSSRIMIDTGSVKSAITVIGSSTPADVSKQAIRIKANEAETTIGILKGNVGIAQEAGETTTVGTISMSYINSKDTDANVVVGEGVTLTTLNKNAGLCYLGCAVITINQDSGTLNTYGSGAITTVNIEGGTFTGNSSGTITTLNIITGTADFSKSLATRTVITAKIDGGGTLIYDPSVLILTNDIAAYDTSGNLKLTATMP